jgi:hypothetical protein
MPTTRRIAGLAVSAAALAAVAFPALSSAAPTPQPGQVTRTLRWDYLQPLPVLGTPVCDRAGHCLQPFSFTDGPPTTGDVAGTSVQSGTGIRLADGTIYANSIVVFAGTLRGCGTGTVAMRSTGVNRAGATSGIIEIVQGSGTGDLEGITGSGYVVNGRADPTGGDQGTGSIILKVHCRR